MMYSEIAAITVSFAIKQSINPSGDSRSYVRRNFAQIAHHKGKSQNDMKIILFEISFTAMKLLKGQLQAAGTEM